MISDRITTAHIFHTMIRSQLHSTSFTHVLSGLACKVSREKTFSKLERMEAGVAKVLKHLVLLFFEIAVMLSPSSSNKVERRHCGGLS